MWGTCQQCREPEGILRITHSFTYKKGRRSLQQEEEYNTNQSLIQQILDHEARISAILKPPRRLKQKRSMEEANRADNIEADVETGSSIKVLKQIEYSYSTKQKYSIQARRDGEAGSACPADCRFMQLAATRWIWT